MGGDVCLLQTSWETDTVLLKPHSTVLRGLTLVHAA